MLNAFLEEFQKRNLWASFLVTGTGCFGLCGTGASVLVYLEGVMYGGVTAADVGAIIDEHLLLDRPVERLCVPPEVWG